MKTAAKTKSKEKVQKFAKPEMINLQRDPKIKTVDDLSFVGLNAEGHLSWWNVTLPKTPYWKPKLELGKAYAYELLDLIHNPDGQVTGQQIGFICGEAGRDPASTSVAQGFFEILGDYLVDGDVGR